VEVKGEEEDEARVGEHIDAVGDGGERLIEELEMGLFGAGECVEEGEGEGVAQIEDLGLQLRLNSCTPTYSCTTSCACLTTSYLKMLCGLTCSSFTSKQ
jgi:hypothetical protein